MMQHRGDKTRVNALRTIYRCRCCRTVARSRHRRLRLLPFFQNDVLGVEESDNLVALSADLT